MNYFEYYGIKPAYQIQVDELRKKYYEKSRLIHPDMRNNEQSDSTFETAFNNQAYQTLNNPLSRLKYIIETYKGPVEENKYSLSQDFLMEMMEFHEEISDARNAGDSSSIENYKKQLIEMEARALNDAASFVNSFDNGSREDSVFDGLTIFYFKLKYYLRLKQILEGNLSEL